MKTLFKSILSISLSVLSLSCGTERTPAAPVWETPGQAVQIGNEGFSDEREDPSATIYGTKSVEVAFVLANLN